MTKRLFDIVVSGAGLVLLAPLLLLLALAIRFESPGPAFYRQERVGLHGRTFRIHKFRTMRHDADQSQQLTVGRDPRVTRLGGLLRRYKLDELPQLIDVIFGDMSLVGPRPEVPQYAALYPPESRDLILSVRPGITEWASIKFVDENELLGQSADPRRTYVEAVLPVKVRYYVDYVRNRSFGGDLRILFATLLSIFR